MLPARSSFKTKMKPHDESSPPTRTLKIEEDGDYWKGLTKPKIRLMGRWLERAGFRPGNRVQVTCLFPGSLNCAPLTTSKPETKSKRREASVRKRAH